MASIFNSWCDATQIVSHIIEQDRESEEDRFRFYHATLILQRYWRGYLARREIKRLHAAATVLQKYIRRFLVRINMANFMLIFLHRRAMRYYNKMATKIQACYKGYKFRKDNFDFRKLYADKLRIAKINEELKQRMRLEKEKEAAYVKAEAENEAKYLVLFILFKLHHMLRTNREGIYSIHNSRELSWIEKLLKSVKYTKYMKALRKMYNDSYQAPVEKKCILQKRWRKCEQAYYLQDKSAEVKTPRISPEPLQKPFCFDTRIPKTYERKMLTQGKYSTGIKHVLREFDKTLNISKKDFDLSKNVTELKSLIPPYYINYWNQICEIHNFTEL